jgi:hypothetical protein
LKGDNASVLLSSTPLEMDNDFLFSASMNNMNSENGKNRELDYQQNKITQSVYYDANNVNKNYDDNKSIDTVNSDANASVQNVSSLITQLDALRDQLNCKTKQNEELSACLLKQTNFCENLSELLRNSDDKSKDLEVTLAKNSTTISHLVAENGSVLLLCSFS